MTVTMYGIKNCDTIKKARAWMDAHGIVGWEVLLNRAGTTFRKLPDADREGIDAGKAAALMLAQPSMIKRPVLEYPGGILVGFKPENYARTLL